MSAVLSDFLASETIQNMYNSNIIIIEIDKLKKLFQPCEH